MDAAFQIKTTLDESNKKRNRQKFGDKNQQNSGFKRPAPPAHFSKSGTKGSHEVAKPPGGAAPPSAAPARGLGPSGVRRHRPFVYLFPETRKP